MCATFRSFFTTEEGAVTVDWVVLTAALVGLGAAVILTISEGALDHANGLGAHLDSHEVTSW